MAGQSMPIREIGVPVRCVNRSRLWAGRDAAGRDCIYATMSQRGANLFVLQIDPDTGRCRQFWPEAPQCNWTTAVHMGRSGRLYIGAAYAGRLLCFDPPKGRLLELGEINPGAATYPCRMDEDSQGRIWIGSYPAADLTCYDPAADAFTRCGPMDETDMYCYAHVNVDGTIACMVRMTRPHVVVLDPATGRKGPVGPAGKPGHHGLELVRAADGCVYLKSPEGDFRLDGFELVAVDSVPGPPPPPALSDGTTFTFLDDLDDSRILEVRRPDGQARTFELNHEVAGSDIFYLHAGPGGRLYGSSILPEHLFRYDPGTSELVDLGRCSLSNGEAYSMANLGERIYIGSYPGARLSVYDTTRLSHFGEQPEDNPRDLGRMDDVSCRPRSTIVGPRGRIWTASLPDYGLWGGPLAWFDPATGERKSYRIFGDGSAYTLAAAGGDLLAVGGTIHAGSGTQPKVRQAELILWDCRAERAVWQGTLDRPVSAFTALVAGPDGRLYGTVRGEGAADEVFAFDPAGRKFLGRTALPEGDGLDLALQLGPDGQLYGVTSKNIYRVRPASSTVTVLMAVNDKISAAGPILGPDLYFASGHRLRAATVL